MQLFTVQNYTGALLFPILFPSHNLLQHLTGQGDPKAQN